MFLHIFLRNCSVCNKEFNTTHPRKKYCSVECYKKVYDNNYKSSYNNKYRVAHRNELSKKWHLSYEHNKDQIKTFNKLYQDRTNFFPNKIKLNCIACNKIIYISPFIKNHHKNHFCSPSCHNIYQLREKHPNWTGGDKIYGITWSREFKKSIRERDNHTCQLCEKHQTQLKRTLDVHHIDYIKTNCFTFNCISLCHDCHTLTNFPISKRNYWMKFFRDYLTDKCGCVYYDAKETKLIL